MIFNHFGAFCFYLERIHSMKKVASGKEAEVVINSNSKHDYRNQLESELMELKNSELWQAGKQVRDLRPDLN